MNVKRFATLSLIILLFLVTCLIVLLKLSSREYPGLPLSSRQVDKLIEAGKGGDAEACWALYLYYVDDEKKESYWLEKAAGYGDPRAQVHLASRLRFHPGKEPKEKALGLLSKAAEQNYASAQEDLVKWYQEGIIVGQKCAHG